MITWGLPIMIRLWPVAACHLQGDHNNTRTGERLNHHCSSNARRSQHQDWRKAQPPLLIQCKEIATPGLENGSLLLIQCKEITTPGLENGSLLLIQCKEITTPGLEKGSTTTAHPMQGDHNTRTGEWLTTAHPMQGDHNTRTGEWLTTAHPMQGDHNTRTGERLNHHCSSNARRSQHQDWRKANTTRRG